MIGLLAVSIFGISNPLSREYATNIGLPNICSNCCISSCDPPHALEIDQPRIVSTSIPVEHEIAL